MLSALQKSHDAVGKPQSIVVGLSGGADSVALLLSLCELREKTSIEIYAVHVNHGLRDNAVLDEAFCAELCDRLNVPLTIVKVHIPGPANVEARAREARYDAFREVMHLRHADVLALGHHMDDQAETVVMHLLYGAGSAGIGGMHVLNNTVWRPFLQLRRSQLQQYVQEHGLCWREDESNADTVYTRNRVRAEVMPALEACAPEAVRSIARAAEIIASEDAYLSGVADEWITQHASRSMCPFLMVEPLADLHEALQRRILRRYAMLAGVQLDYQQTERLRSAIDAKPGEIVNLPQGRHALRTKRRLHFVGGCSVKMLGTLSVGQRPESGRVMQSHLLPQREMHDLELRTRRAGDVIQPFGMEGHKPLKEYMSDHGVDRPFRDSWPLVCRGKEVLWVIGVGASEKLRVNAEDPDTHEMIYSGVLPDYMGG